MHPKKLDRKEKLQEVHFYMAALTYFDTITPLLYRNTYLSRNNDKKFFKRY